MTHARWPVVSPFPAGPAFCAREAANSDRTERAGRIRVVLSDRYRREARPAGVAMSAGDDGRPPLARRPMLPPGLARGRRMRFVHEHIDVRVIS